MKLRIPLMMKVFREEQHADAFLQRGELYCLNLAYFKRLEDGEGRGDPYEGVTDWFQPDQIELRIKLKGPDGNEQDLHLDDLAGPVSVQYNGYDPLNLFCLHAIKIPEFEETFSSEAERLMVIEKINSMLKERTALSEKMQSMGDFAVLIHKVDSFRDRVGLAAKAKKLNLARGLVEYYDPETFHGSFRGLESVFRKRKSFEHQSEYRFCFQSQIPIEKLYLHVGSLEDIALKVPTKEISKKLEIKLAE